MYVVRPDGTGLAPLVATAVDEESPAWSPDGTQLAFTRPDGVWTAQADGTGRRRVATASNALNPTWSLDGARIAFQASAAPAPTPESFEIGVVAASGGSPTMLQPGFAPAWSPDGARIAFATATAVAVGVPVLPRRPGPPVLGCC